MGIQTKPWFWITSGFLTALTVLGNGLVTLLICSRERLHTKTNWFVFSLAAADFMLACVFIPPFFTCEKYNTSCKNQYIIWYFISYFAYNSVTNLMALTFDRYTAIVFPLQYNCRMTRKRIILIILLAWLSPLVLDSIPIIFLPRVFDKGEEIAQVWSMVIFQILPCIILCVVSRKIFREAGRHSFRSKVLLRQLCFNHPKTRGKSEKSSARLIGTLLIVFLVCWSAQALSSLCFCFKACIDFQPEEAVRYSLALLLLTNSAANPVIYAFLKRDIRGELRRTLVARPTLNSC